MKAAIILETHYWPSTHYFSHLSSCQLLIVENHENYIKQTYRNRAKILASNGPQSLIIPISKAKGTLITEVEPDYTQPWVRTHLRAIQTAYGKSPYYEHYMPIIERVLSTSFGSLFDLNFEILTLCLRWLTLEVQLQKSPHYAKSYQDTAIYDARNILCVDFEKKTEFSGDIVAYHQTFGRHFEEGLSILDLIFNKGPQSAYVIQEMSRSRKPGKVDI